MRKFAIFSLLWVSVWLVACAQEIQASDAVPAIPSNSEPSQVPSMAPTIISATSETTATPVSSSKFGYTHFGADGNRYIEGQTDLPNSVVMDIRLAGTPEWVVAVPYEDISLWAVVLQDGQVQAFWISSQGAEPAQITPEQLPKESIPLLAITGQIASLVTVPHADQSLPTHPIEVMDGDMGAFIQTNGNLSLTDSNNDLIASLEINALTDARILHNRAKQLIMLTGPTDSYTHGVLGDAYEATQITIIDLAPSPRITHNIQIPKGQVIEGIAPIWVDWDFDGEREIIVTLSDAINGAQLAVFNNAGKMIASSTAIGQGFRWRHQLAVAPFGPNGEWELVDVLTPHIGGVVEFFQWQGDQLEKVAQVSGYTSHVIGTRNLDMAIAGDFDANGQVELLIPNQGLTELGAIRRTMQGAEIPWALPAGGKISTNIGAVSLADGGIAVAVGRSDGHLRIWYPP
jgi:hypothetical protein